VENKALPASQILCRVWLLTSQSLLKANSSDKMLYLVGLGLADETDITVKGLSIVKKAERVYLEAYTSILLVDKEKLVSHPYYAQALVLTLHSKLTQGRKPSMAAPSSSQIVNSLRVAPMISSKVRTTRILPSSLWAIRLARRRIRTWFCGRGN
jgi:hypothetical protein